MQEPGPVDPTAPDSITNPGANVPASTRHIEHGRADGVRTVWGDDDPAIELHATLAFRVGEADERLRTRGNCHLLCALVLEAIDPDPAVRVDASILSLRTRFIVSGPDEAVAATLTAIARAIATARTDHLDRVIPGVVATWHPPENWDTRLMSLRFGSRGYGLLALPLLGLADVDQRNLDEWIHSWFNAENAVLSANRRPITEVDLGALSAGEHKPLPTPRQRDIAFPALAVHEDEQIAFSFLSRFDASARLAFAITLDRIHSRCRALDPAIPQPRSTIRRTGTGLATISIAVDVARSNVPGIRDAISSELFDLSLAGPTEVELGRAQIGLRRSRTGSGKAASQTVRDTAMDVLYREDRDTNAALRADPGVIATIIRDAVSRAIWIVPVRVTIQDQRFTMIGDRVPPIRTGECFAAKTADVPESAETLTIDEVGLTMTDPSVTVLFEDLVALEAYPDGTRVFWSENGTTARVDQRDWSRGDRISSLIDERVAPWTVIRHQGHPDTVGTGEDQDTALPAAMDPWSSAPSESTAHGR